MTSRRSLALFLAVLAVVAASAPRTSVTAAEREVAAPACRLLRVQELRRHDVVTPEQDAFSMETTGLTLKFDLALPGDRRLLEISNPDRRDVEAVDSTGRDLSGVEKNFVNKREYVKLIQFYGKDPEGFTFHLGLPARPATSFDLHVELEAVTFTDTEEVSLEVSEEWTELDASMSGKKKVQARIERKGSEVTLAVRPGTVKASIEDVALLERGSELESSYSMWNDMRINYVFNGTPQGPLTARLKVRTGLATQRLTIALEDQPLP